MAVTDLKQKQNQNQNQNQAISAEPLGIDGVPQANIIPSIHGKPEKSRHRASVACAACRDRRTRCVVPAGEKECTQCQNAGYECVIRHDDERRKPNSKAYTQSLTNRIDVLEKMLKEKGEEPPPAQYPAKIRLNTSRAPAEPVTLGERALPGEMIVVRSTSPELTEPEASNPEAGEENSSPDSVYPLQKESMVRRLLSTRGHLSFDQLSGRLRYFGPTTNCHIYSELSPQPDEASRRMLEQQRRTEKIIRTLSADTHDYLMDLFWQHYNSVLHVVHEAAFHEDRKDCKSQFYSGFLHICILAMGYRFADSSRPDIAMIALPSRESTLHREAKYMLDCELEQPGGIPTIAAMLLLGDLECGVGRDNLGWLYAGIANRLCFDIGLHLDNRNSGLPQHEIEIGRMTLWACVVFDKYWALFLGRPTSLKSADLEIYGLAQQFERLGACQPAGPTKSLETQVYEALLDLMELAGKIIDVVEPESKSNAPIDHHAYLRLAALDKELGSWYSRLAKALQWTPENIKSAPFSFFLLHQQYHCTLILLHRPFAMYEESKSTSESDDSADNDSSSRPDNHFSALSRAVCTKHAVRVARIFWQHRQRFDTKQICVTGLQHAGTAAIALVAALAYLKDPSTRASNMQYLECLAAALQDMTHTYQPAERMSTVLQAVMAELRDSLPPSSRHVTRSVIPARRPSTTDDYNEDQVITFKKRHANRPKSRRTLSQSSTQHAQVRPLSDFPETASSTEVQEVEVNLGLDAAMSDLPPSAFDGFVMVTPRAETSNYNNSWPSLGSADACALDYPMSTNATSGRSSSFHSNSLTVANSRSAFRSAWMGAETPAISPLPSASRSSTFRSLDPARPTDDKLEDMAGTNVNDIQFLPLLNGDGWDSSSIRGGPDHDGFPMRSMPIDPGPVKGTSVKARSSQAEGANDTPAGTIGGLSDMWNEMLSSSRY